MGQILIITIVKCILLLKVYAKYIKANIINLTAAKVLPNRNFSIAFKGNRALFTLFGVNFSSFDRLLRHSKGTVQILFFLEQHLIIYR